MASHVAGSLREDSLAQWEGVVKDLFFTGKGFSMFFQDGESWTLDFTKEAKVICSTKKIKKEPVQCCLGSSLVEITTQAIFFIVPILVSYLPVPGALSSLVLLDSRLLL